MLISNLFQVKSKKAFTRITTLTEKHSVADFFVLDICSIPDSDFHKSELRLNNKGEIVQRFRKKLNYKECGLFDIAEVAVIDSVEKRVAFKSSRPDKIKLKDLKTVTEQLDLLYGKNSGGGISTEDISLSDGNHERPNDSFIRRWSNENKFSLTVTIRKSADELAFIISGLE